MKNIRLIFSTIIVLASCFEMFAQRPTASFTVPNTLRCSNQTFSLTSTSTIGVGSIAQEKWIFVTGDPKDTVLQTGSGNTVDYQLGEGSYIVYLVAFGSNGQSDTADGVIRIDIAPEASFETSVPCFPDMIILNSTSDAKDGTISSLEWQIAGLLSNDNTLQYTGSVGMIPLQLAVESSNGCTDTASTTLNYTNTPQLVFNGQGPLKLCEGDNITLSVSGANRYVWNNGTAGSENTISSAGYKVVEGFTSDQCSAKDSILINSFPKPTADAGSDIIIRQGESTTLQGSGGITFTWTPSTGLSDSRIANPEANPLATTQYVLTVVDENDCSDTDSILLTVDDVSSVPVQNIITPNNDGYNDVWDLSSVPNIENAEVFVYNRWGWEVFKAEDGYNNNWDGTMADEPLTDGSYLYVIKYKDDGIQPLRGVLQIIRNVQK